MSTTTDAVSRYQYLLRTADPMQIEQAHEQAFAAMTPTERTEVLQALSKTSEVPSEASASSLARSATRLEVQRPGTLQQLLGGRSSLGTTLLASLAAGFVGSAAWTSVTGGDGLGGRPGLLARLLEFRGRSSGYVGLGGSGMFGGPSPRRGRRRGGSDRPPDGRSRSRGTGSVEADADRVTQVLTNLVDNALMATRARGQVTIALGSAQDAVTVDVIDDGPGVPPAEAERVFERLVRLDPSRSSRGSGLGLSIARGIAEAHGGSLVLVPRVGPGARFRLALPTRAP